MKQTTSSEIFTATKSEVLGKLANVPAEISLTNMETFEDYTLNTVAAKSELIAAIQKIDKYTPAFTPIDNIRFGLHAASSDAKNVLEYSIAN